MITSIDEYLLKLKKELSGCDPAIVQEALSDSVEHLTGALSNARAIHPDQTESTVLKEVIKNYGMPEEIAATYKEIEARKSAATGKKRIATYLVVFFLTLFSAAYFLGQGILLLNWEGLAGNGFGNMMQGGNRGNSFFIWTILCLVTGGALGILAYYVWRSYRKGKKELPLPIHLLPTLPFLAQGIALLFYFSTRTDFAAGTDMGERYNSRTALLFGILSLVLAFILLLAWRIVSKFRQDWIRKG